MSQWVETVWPGSGYGARRDRKPFRYAAFVPDRVADWDRPLAGRAAEAVSQATAAVAGLQNGDVGRDLESLAGPLLRAEAQGSSFIEGLRASNRRVALASYEPLAADGTANAVANNVLAMQEAVRIGADRDAFTVEQLLLLHRTLLRGTSEECFAGKVRKSQNWIGGRGLSPADADFVPPPPEMVPDLLDDLIDFVALDDLPAIAQAAIAHAQFETIHPFGDGNGRTGRCLIHVILRRRGLASTVVPPVSVVLAASARRYVAGLTDYRRGDIDDWIGFFADAVTDAAEASRSLWGRIGHLIDALIERSGRPCAGSTARRILQGLPAEPIVSADTAASRYGVSQAAARAALNELQRSGALIPTRVGRRRGRKWTSDELFELLDAFEYGLADEEGTVAGRRAPPPTLPRRSP